MHIETTSELRNALFQCFHPVASLPPTVESSLCATNFWRALSMHPTSAPKAGFAVVMGVWFVHDSVRLYDVIFSSTSLSVPLGG